MFEHCLNMFEHCLNMFEQMFEQMFVCVRTEVDADWSASQSCQTGLTGLCTNLQHCIFMGMPGQCCNTLAANLANVWSRHVQTCYQTDRLTVTDIISVLIPFVVKMTSRYLTPAPLHEIIHLLIPYVVKMTSQYLTLHPTRDNPF